ncbi:MAG: TadE family protein [Elusimicrobiota bacterium]|nr:TadE family protein [Elusimicrobiota bacterium]
MKIMKAIFKKILQRRSALLLRQGFEGEVCPKSSILKKGQVTVELMLVLPIFFLMIFFIMELGNVAFQTILYHHSAYEIARIGSLVAGPKGGSVSSGSNVGFATAKMKSVLNKMKINCKLQPSPIAEVTGADPQVQATGATHINEDLILSLTCKAKLIFPVARYFLSDPPRVQGMKKIIVKVRMPIEKPIFQ